MNFQGQLGFPQPSSSSAFIWPSGQDFRSDVGLLHNEEIQTPSASPSLSNLAGKIVRNEAALVTRKESANMEWLVRNAVELGRYKGEWLLIDQQRLTVHDPDFAAIRRAINQQQIASPFVYYVPTDEESNSASI